VCKILIIKMVDKHLRSTVIFLDKKLNVTTKDIVNQRVIVAAVSCLGMTDLMSEPTLVPSPDCINDASVYMVKWL
jgi:hypothetical protein